MTKLGDRFSNVREGFDKYVAPKGTSDTSGSLNFGEDNDYRQHISSLYVPNNSVNVPFTSRPLANAITRNQVYGFQSINNVSAAPVQKTFLGRPIYQAGKRTDGTFNHIFESNPIKYNPIMKKAYFNFFVHGGNKKTLLIKLGHIENATFNNASLKYTDNSYNLDISGNQTQLVRLPIYKLDGIDKLGFDSRNYFTVRVELKPISSTANLILETFCYSLTLVPPEKVTDLSDYLKTGI